MTEKPDAVPYSSVPRYLREARFPPSKPELHPADVQKDLDDSDQVILSAIEDNAFASVPQLSRLTNLPSTTVDRRLTQSLRFVARHLRWMLHALSDARKDERVNLSRRLLRMRMLEVQCDRAWYDIVTGDESWFYLSTDSEFVWLPHDEKFQKENDTQFNRKKFVFTIVWNPRVFYLIKVLKKGRKFNSGYYIAEILEPLSQWCSIEVADNERKLLLHADNARPHPPSYQLNILTRIK
jgi:hypothetical protein